MPASIPTEGGSTAARPNRDIIFSSHRTANIASMAFSPLTSLNPSFGNIFHHFLSLTGMSQIAYRVDWIDGPNSTHYDYPLSEMDLRKKSIDSAVPSADLWQF